MDDIIVVPLNKMFCLREVPHVAVGLPYGHEPLGNPLTRK